MVWSNGRMIVWPGILGSSVIRSGVVRSYGPITRTYSMPLNPPFEAKARLKVTFGNQQDILYFNKIEVYSCEKLNSSIPHTEHLVFNSLHINAHIYSISVQLYTNVSFIKNCL